MFHSIKEVKSFVSVDEKLLHSDYTDGVVHEKEKFLCLPGQYDHMTVISFPK